MNNRAEDTMYTCGQEDIIVEDHLLYTCTCKCKVYYENCA